MESSKTMKNTKTMMLHVAVAALLPLLCAAPAQAGFEWTPPPAAPAVSTPALETIPSVPAAPADHVDMMELTPIPGAPVSAPTATMAPVEALPSPSLATAPVAAPVVAPVIERESEALPTPSPEILVAPRPAGPFANVDGFGADIPLALALGQIVPAEFAYSFASNVNPGLKISWDGGKPWNEVLNEALAVHGLRADVAGTAVVVRQGAHADTQGSAPINTLATPIGKQSAATYNTTPRPPADAPLSAASVSEHAAATGEGSANYPRRTPPRNGIFDSIFTPDQHKGNMAPRPPVDTPKVIVRNEVAPEDMNALNTEIAARPLSAEATEPKTVAAVEPAAPAVMAPLPTQAPSRAPTSLGAQRISYADEDVRQRTDILPDRTHSESVRAQGAVLDPFQVSFWQADNNANLREVLNAWAAQAGVEVIWDSGYDYKLPNSISLHGTFPEAVTRVFDLYGTAEPRPQGKLHPNLPKGPSVLLVENFP